MKKAIIWFSKAAVAAFIAFLIGSVFCYFYYNLPRHYTNPTGATDYLWDANHLSIRGTEGFAHTQTDEFGFVNTYPEKKDIPDVLIMGSSHTEGFNVDGDKNYTYLLNQKFKDNGWDLFAYNIGTSGHDLLRCLNNLENAVETYTPTREIVLETYAIDFSIEDLERLNNQDYTPLPSYDSGVLFWLQQSDLLRLMHTQLSNFMEKDQATPPPTADEEDLKEYQALLETALKRAAEIGENNGCRVTILYCPPLSIDYNGDVIPQPYTEKQALFKACCEKYNVTFVDMFSSFEAMYEETYHLPHGFTTSAVGVGHTNEYGHACMAEVLYSTITKG